MGNAPGAGVLFLGEAERGVVGVLDLLTLNRDLLNEVLLLYDGAANEMRRWGVEIDKVERPRTEPVRVRGGPWLLVSDTGEFAISVAVTIGTLSTSCHWRCRITDSVAHCIKYQQKSRRQDFTTYRH
jgi:hypothetical protein